MYSPQVIATIITLAKITQLDLANLLGTTQASVSRYISGDQKLPPKQAEILTDLIGEHNKFLLQAINGSMIAIGDDLQKRMRNTKGDR
ncbi:transcriptional regulator [Bacillus cereus]|uniref:helix-turn-helix domain-containing protein n=1 Tax=Bacillus cereus group TaxID=86661 RepID=UPI000BEDDECA|nr:helix-turn-helix domain-containing protein [Bacillus toyonensis]MCU5408843.1 helix-turn-helix domain-containing protein [Bacillus cereus]PEC41484.1 transcriptional regulator [Bacillus toyonensis]PFM63989.1 transcriptional regulator [Bacillus cereus]PGP79265.1 transcriptional regulator [Bacillus cereus]